MAVHIIKISLNSSGNLVVDPDLCVVDPEPEPSYILLVLDETIKSYAGGKPGFAWDDPSMPAWFASPSPEAGGNIILIKDKHVGKDTKGYWFYQPSVANVNAAAQTKNQTGTCIKGYIRNEKHPVIINK